MSYKEEDIMYENGSFWVLRERKKDRDVFYTYKNEATHSRLVGTFDIKDGLKRAIADADKRAKK